MPRAPYFSKLPQASPAWPAAALALAALGYRLWIAAQHGHGSFDGSMVKGLPYSDGWGWYTVSLEFSRGERWSHLWSGDLWGPIRPLYYLFMGSVFAWTGPSLGVARAVHFLLGSIGAVLIFDGLRRIGPFGVAVAAALAHAFSYPDAMRSLGTMTETFGSFLTNAWLWSFAVGMQKMAAPAEGDTRSLTRTLAASGMWLALANLARPLNLPAAAPLALLPAFVFFPASAARRRQILLASGAFFAATVVVVTPWLVRQRVLYGITTLSFNSAEAFYAATSPRFGTWTPEVRALTDGMDVGARTAFYKAGARRQLKEHWRWYLGNTARHLAAAAVQVRPPRLLLAGAGALFLALAWRRRAARGWPGLVLALAVTASAALPDSARWLSWVAAALVALAVRHPMSLLAAALASTLALLGALALPADRLTYSMEWMALALALWLVCWLAEPEATRPAHVPAWGRAGLWLARASLVAGLWLGAGLALAVVRNLAAAPGPPVVLDAVTALAWHERLRSVLPPPYVHVRHHTAVVAVRLAGDYQIPMAAGERLVHWSALLVPRDYDYTLIGLRPSFSLRGGLGTAFAVFPGSVPREVLAREGEVVLLGVPVIHESREEAFEVVAVGWKDGTGSHARAIASDGVQATHAKHLLELVRSADRLKKAG